MKFSFLLRIVLVCPTIIVLVSSNESKPSESDLNNPFKTEILEVYPNGQRSVKESSQVMDELSANSVLYSVLSEAVKPNSLSVRQDCVDDLRLLFDGINHMKLWAIKALDASGTPRQSFVWGQNAWLGSRRECHYLNHPPKYSLTPELRRTMDSTLISSLAPFDMDLRMVFANVTSPNHFDSINYYPIPHRIGLCLPSVCTDAEVKRLVQKVFTEKMLVIQRLMEMDVDVMLVRSMRWENFLRRKEVWWIVALIVAVAAVVVVFSALYDVIVDRPKSRLTDFLVCFSIRSNVQTMFDMKRPPHSISSMNGIRTIVCFWILVIHVPFFTMFAYDNLPALFQMLDTAIAQPVFAAALYVDSFFVMSAMLLVTNFLRNETKLNAIREADFVTNAKAIWRHIFHRYTRLTPVFLFTIAISHVLSIYLEESSSLYVDRKFDLYCSVGGLWHSLLYIHNLFPVTDMCIAWSWYLACDMQFYIFVLVLLFIYAKHPKIAVLCFCVVTVGVCAFCLSILMSLDITIRIDSVFKNFVHIYAVPWMRIGPYLAGTAAGFVMSHMQTGERKLPTSPRSVRAYWSVATLIFLCSLFFAYEKRSSIFVVTAASLGRLFIGIFVSSVIIACSMQAGGWLDRFLSASPFLHLNRLTYCGYLLNPVVTVALRASTESSIHFDISSTLTMVCCVTVITYISSVVVSLLFEMPFQRLSDVYIMRKKITSRE